MDKKKFSRTTSHRRALWRNMAAALIQHGAIRTTETKAKQLRRFVEKLITAAKKGTLQARRQVIAELADRDMFDDEGELLEQTVVQKLFDEIAPRYVDRNGGYTRIVHLAERRLGDAGRQVLLQLIEEQAGGSASAGSSRRKKRAVRRQQAAAAVDDQVEAEADEGEQTPQDNPAEQPRDEQPVDENAGEDESPDQSAQQKSENEDQDTQTAEDEDK